MCFLLTLETMNHLLTSRFVFVLSSNGGGGNAVSVQRRLAVRTTDCCGGGPSMSLASRPQYVTRVVHCEL